jgi:hypothetical protein
MHYERASLSALDLEGVLPALRDVARGDDRLFLLEQNVRR